MGGLLLGKPRGFFLFSALARLTGGTLPARFESGDLLVVGVVAAIGFTVSLFFATAAFPGGAALAETKMGALLSFVAAPVALLVARIVRGPVRAQRVMESVDARAKATRISRER